MRPVLLFTMLCFLFPHPSEAYRFTCNGVDADGNWENDECGVCNDQSGPRWGTPSNVPVQIDPNIRPPTLSQADWMNVAKASMNSWNTVSGASLRLNYIGDASTREFGSNDANHEIFWVTDANEWKRKVGGGGNGVLGVTVAPYNCPTSSKPSREIYDADLILNGTGQFKWAPTCAEWGDCVSIQSTLTHELGHFVGLGHPCPSCDWSIMSAQAGFNVQYPEFDDMQGLRVLYPASTSSAQMGMACNVSGECQSGLACVAQTSTQGVSHFCAQACTGGCSAGYVCDRSDGYCKFPIGTLGGAAGKGDNCAERPCGDDLLCVGTGGSAYSCFASCANDSACGTGESCAPLQDGGGACMHLAKLSEKCDDVTPCASHLLCVRDSAGKGQCYQGCKPDISGQCPIGVACVSVGAGLGACGAKPTIGHQPSTASNVEPGAVADGEDAPSRCSCTSLPTAMSFFAPGSGLLALAFLGRAFRRRAK